MLPVSSTGCDHLLCLRLTATPARPCRVSASRICVIGDRIAASGYAFALAGMAFSASWSLPVTRSVQGKYLFERAKHLFSCANRSDEIARQYLLSGGRLQA